MDKRAILALFDKEQRYEVVFGDTRREVTPHLVRRVNRGGGQGFIIWTQLTHDNVERVAREEIAYFEALGQSFEWKVYDHDQPPDLRERLVALGFAAEEPEALLIYDIDRAPPDVLTLKRPEIQPVTDAEGIHALAHMEAQVWHKDLSGLAQRLINDLNERPDELSIYAAYIDNQLVSAAWVYFHPGSQFASLWGGTTLPEYRKRGLYGALLAIRIQAAKQRGVRFLTVDASPMSRPLLERRGFEFFGFSHPCIWNVTTDSQ